MAAVVIERLSHEGRGIAIDGGKAVFIDGALPKERVEYKITKKSKTYQEGYAVEISDPHAARVSPICPAFLKCGGCSLQHMDPDYQLEIKALHLKEQLLHFGKVTPGCFLPPLRARTQGYRRKARLGVKYVIKKSQLLVGFREKYSHFLAEMTHCPILHPVLSGLLGPLKSLISGLSVFQDIPQIEMAMGDEGVGLVLRHLKPLSPLDQQQCADFAEQYDLILYLQPNPPAPWINISRSQREYLTYCLEDYGLSFEFSPLDFTQVNLGVNCLMVRQALALLDLGPCDTVLDLFCGLGNFTLPIAQSVQNVVGIEGDMKMVERAASNAKRNNLSNAAFYQADLSHEITAAGAAQGWGSAGYTKLLLDPPRLGALALLPWIGRLPAKRLVYVSCNPATLARDVGILVHQYGFELASVGILDMFTHTAHVESMALLIRDPCRRGST
jgi:23S rRNA (uracil1939-C5)-methyltransferase